MTILETDRLILSQLSLRDAPFIFELVNSPGWLEFIGDRGIRTTTDAEKYIANGPLTSYKKNGHGLYLVSLKDGAAPIGICGIIKRDSLEDKDIGFAFLPEYSGKGYAFEAAIATVQYAKEILGIKRIVAITLEINQRSVNLLTKLGFVFEKMISSAGEKLMLYVNEQPEHLSADTR